MARLPQPGGDINDWGVILNDYLSVSLNQDGTLLPTAVTSAGGYTKPVSGIPSTDLSSSVQASLTAANNAVQIGGDIAGTPTSPTVAKVSGVAVSGTPSVGNSIVATSATTASWQAVSGGATNQHTVVSKSSSYTLTTSDEVVLASASLLSLTMTLPTAVSNKNMYTIKKTDSSTNTITVAPPGGQTIDGGGSAVLKVQYASVSVVSDGSNWFIV